MIFRQANICVSGSVRGVLSFYSLFRDVRLLQNKSFQKFYPDKLGNSELITGELEISLPVNVGYSLYPK